MYCSGRFVLHFSNSSWTIAKFKRILKGRHLKVYGTQNCLSCSCNMWYTHPSNEADVKEQLKSAQEVRISVPDFFFGAIFDRFWKCRVGHYLCEFLELGSMAGHSAADAGAEASIPEQWNEASGLKFPEATQKAIQMLGWRRDRWMFNEFSL